MRVERQCAQCGKAFVRDVYPSQVGRGAKALYCSPKCSAVARSDRRRITGRYRNRYSPGHPLSDSRGAVLAHRFELYEKIGPGWHSCHWCGRKVRWSRGGRTGDGVLVVDHLDSDGHNNSPENLVPSCHGCNSTRGRSDMISSDEPHVVRTDGSRARSVPRVCQRCGTAFLIPPAALRKKGAGTYCSLNCLWKRRST